MSNLSRLQHEFQARVLDPDATDTPAWVSAGGRAEPTIQIGVYSFAYRARLQEVLAKDFPATHQAMGDENFYTLISDYIEAYPSRYFSLRDFGQDFSNFLAQQVVNDEHPWLAELAEFEWTLCSAFDAANSPLLSELDMAGIAPDRWPKMRFAVHPSLRCLTVNWNIPELWKILTSDNPQDLQVTTEPGTSWLIWREKLITRFRSLSEDEHAAMKCLCTDGSFNDVCLVLAEFHASEDVPLHAATFLKTWLAQGLLTRII